MRIANLLQLEPGPTMATLADGRPFLDAKLMNFYLGGLRGAATGMIVDLWNEMRCLWLTNRAAWPAS
jgi:hypothetical protein